MSMRNEPTCPLSPPARRPSALFWSGIIVGFAVGASASVASLAGATEPSPSGEHLRSFAGALARVQRTYVETVEEDVLIEGAMRGMLESLDPHSAYFDAEEYGRFRSATEGRFAGVGVAVGVMDGWIVVLGVLPGGPAEQAGLRPGDRFVTIGGTPARDMRVTEAVRIMRGEPGTLVSVSVRREGEDRDLPFEIRREMVAVDAVSSRLLPDGVLIVRIFTFAENTTPELRSAIDRALIERPEGLRGIILDLRDNGGGLLRESIDVVDEFVSRGTIVSTRGRDGALRSEARAHRIGTRPNWPIVVLVNGRSASASEIVAGALQDLGRATIVGTRTFGKGSVQTLVPLPNGGAMKLTVARYYTPTGRSIQTHGVTPDIEALALAPDTVRSARESGVSERDLEGHLDDERGSPGEIAPSETHDPVARDALRGADRARATAASDHQLEVAVQTVRVLASRAAR